MNETLAPVAEASVEVPAPNYTQMPNVLISLMPQMKEAELRVTLAIARETFGWHRKEKSLSLTRLCVLTGLSRQGVLNGIEEGLERHFIERRAQGNSFTYRLLVNEVDQSRPLTGQASGPDRSTTSTTIVREVDQEVVNKVDTAKKEGKKLSKRETKKKKRCRASADSLPKPSHPDLLFEAVAEACAIDTLVCTKEQRGALNQTVGIFRKADRTPDQVRAIRRWWDANDWRGKKGSVPTPAQLREVSGQATAEQLRIDAEWRSLRQRELSLYLEVIPDHPERAYIEETLRLLPTISREDYNPRREALRDAGLQVS